MWVIVLEAMVALSLLLLIVWLTMGGSRRHDSAAQPPKELERKSDSDIDR